MGGRYSTMLAVAVAGSLLCGCGGTSPATSARAINLRTADVPGSTAGVSSQHPVARGPLLTPTERCDRGLPGPRGVLAYSSSRIYVPPSRAPSPGPNPEEQGIHVVPFVTARSSVYVLASQAAALRELAVLSSPRALVCVRQMLRSTVVIGGESGRAGTPERAFREPAYRGADVGAIPVSLPHAFGLQVIDDDAFFGAALGHATREYHHILGFVAGRALVVLFTWSRRMPFPASLEKRLLAALYERAQANPL